MPVLRLPEDNSLANTVGNLGQALSNALNPMNQLRAQDMMAQMQQRRFELQQAQQRDAANANAAEVYGNANPHNQNPADLEVSKAQIRNGTFNLAPTIDALVAAGTMDARNKAADLYRTTHPDLPPDQLASDEADLRSGRKNASELATDRAAAAENVNRATATIAGTEAARKAGVSSLAPANSALAAEAAARGDVGAATKTIAQGDVLNTPSPETLASPETTTLQTKQAIGGVSPPAGRAPTTELQPQADEAAAAQAAELARRNEVGKLVGGGIAPSGTFFPFGLPGSPTNPFSSNPLNAPAPPPNAPPAPPTPDISIPNAESPSAQPVPVVRATPSTQNPAAAVVGESGPEATQRTAIDTGTRTQLQEAVDSGVAGIKMMSLLDRLKTLAHLANTGGSGQIPTWVDSWLRDKGLVITNRQGILAEMQAEFNAQIPELRKDMGVRFEAGPELSAQSKMIGNPNLPEDVLMGIFARQAAVAQLGIDRRNLAMRALYPNQPNALSMADYLKEEAKIYDNLGAQTQQQLKDFGAITPESLAPAPTPPAMGANSTMDAIRAFLRHLGGGDTTQTPPSSQPPPNPTEVWDVDAQGHKFRVR